MLILTKRKLITGATAMAAYTALPSQAATVLPLGGTGASTPPPPPWTLLASTSVINSGTGTVTSSAIDTTGANFIGLITAYYGGGGGPPTFSDNKSNTYNNNLLTLNNTGGVILRSDTTTGFAYTVGSGHTFSINNVGVSLQSVLGVVAFKSATGTVQQDFNGGAGVSGSSNGLGSGTTTIPVPSVTGTHVNDLYLTGLSDGRSSTSGSSYTVTGGLATPIIVTAIGGTRLGLGVGWISLSTTSGAGVTWTISPATDYNVIGGALLIGSW